MNSLSFETFDQVEMRVGTILDVTINAKAKKPAYVLTIDFGPLGIKRSSAQLTNLYQANDLVGKQIVAVVNFPVKQIASMQSECLVLGAVDGQKVVILQTERPVKNGLRIA